MPLFKHHGSFHYFAHVPKCAGTSIERYLEFRFGRLAFFDYRGGETPWYLQWTKASAQHIAWNDLLSIVPQEWISSTFAVVRHPLSRLVSSYNMRLNAGHVPALLSIEDFVADYITERRYKPFKYDNHLRPQTDIVPPQGRIFRIEDGIDSVQDYIDSEFGPWAKPAKISHISHTDMASDPFEFTGTISDRLVELTLELYREDYNRFGYDALPGRYPKLLQVKSEFSGAQLKMLYDIAGWKMKNYYRKLRMSLLSTTD